MILVNESLNDHFMSCSRDKYGFLGCNEVLEWPQVLVAAQGGQRCVVRYL